ncbi:hypothetical protein H5410_045357 [Solanum commersonii]|uniref:Uncharacterized protein n=1 Tax=Solanum commersonii TaxID=4109 RepID=A0A9J5X9D8_SOLCO|nr:hypothetical protein H5410_045357 [Solanum commersonii]
MKLMSCRIAYSNGLLVWSNPFDNFVGINTDGTVENEVVSDLNEDYSDLNGIDIDLPGADTYQNEVDIDLPSSDTYNKTTPKEVPIGEIDVDRGFEDIRINEKIDMFVSKLHKQLSKIHNLLVKVHTEVAILNKKAPTNLDQQDSSNLHQQHLAIILLQLQFVVIEVELRGGEPKRPTNGVSSNVGFGIYTSASGTQILNENLSQTLSLK